VIDKHEIETKVKEALKKVIDPEIGINIVDSGFVREVNVDDEGNVTIKMMLTTPFCPLAHSLAAWAEQAARGVEGVKDVNVVIVNYGIPPELERLLKQGRGKE